MAEEKTNWIEVNGARPDLPAAKDLQIMREVRHELWAVLTSRRETQQNAVLAVSLLLETAVRVGVASIGLEYTRKIFTHTIGQVPAWQAAPPKR